MEEERGENACAYRHVWVESGQGTVQFMNRLVSGFLVFLISIGLARAGERGYQLIADRDSKDL